MTDDLHSQDAESSVVSQPAEKTPLDLYDEALAPFLKRLTGIGVVTEHQLLAFATAHRTALAAAFGLTPPPVDNGGESRDMLTEQRLAAREASVGQAEPVVAAPQNPAGEPIEPEPPPEEPPPASPAEAFAASQRAAEAFDDVTPAPVGPVF